MSAAPAGQHDVPLLVAGQVRLHTRRDGSQTRSHRLGGWVPAAGRVWPSGCACESSRRCVVLHHSAGSLRPATICHMPPAVCRLPAAVCRLSAVRLAPGTARLTLPRGRRATCCRRKGSRASTCSAWPTGKSGGFAKRDSPQSRCAESLTNTLSRTYQHVPMQMDTLGREDTTSTFGILHLARNEPYFATARAMTGGKVYTLSSANFNDLIGAPCSSSRRSWVALTPRCWCRSQPDHRAGVAAQSEHGAAPTVPRCVSRRPPTG